MYLCIIFPAGSGSTHSSSSGESFRSGEPVPVPSQRATFTHLASSASPDSPRHPHPPTAATTRPSPPAPRSQPITMRRISDHRTPDLASLSPPAVSLPSLLSCLPNTNILDQKNVNDDNVPIVYTVGWLLLFQPHITIQVNLFPLLAVA